MGGFFNHSDSVCVCSLCQQNQFCNQTGSPHTDLFPLNNETLQVDIYKGVRVIFRLRCVTRQPACYHLVAERVVTMRSWCVFPGSGPGLLLRACGSLHLGSGHPGSRTELHHDRHLLWPVRDGGKSACRFTSGSYIAIIQGPVCSIWRV